MSIRTAKDKKVSSSIWGVNMKFQLVGTNHTAYFMFPVMASLDTFCKSLGINGLMDLENHLQVFIFYLVNKATNFQLWKRFTACRERQANFLQYQTNMNKNAAIKINLVRLKVYYAKDRALNLYEKRTSIRSLIKRKVLKPRIGSFLQDHLFTVTFKM